MSGKQPFRTDLSINDIHVLAWNASQGNEMSYTILKEQNRKLAKIANVRMKALEKAGYDMMAYDRAHTYLELQGLKQFSTKLASPSDYKGMVKQLQELTTFINLESSTVAGAKKALNKKLQTISDFTGKTYSEEQKLALGRLLSNDSITTLLRDVRGDSGEVIDALEELSLTDVDTQAINEVIDKYLAGYDPFGDSFDYLNYDEMMNELRALYQER